MLYFLGGLYLIMAIISVAIGRPWVETNDLLQWACIMILGARVTDLEDD